MTSASKIAGKSGFDHTIDFPIPKSQVKPVRMIKAVGNPQNREIGNYTFGLTDPDEARRNEPGWPANCYAFLNDQDHSVAADIPDALSAYQISPVIWSRRDTCLTALVG